MTKKLAALAAFAALATLPAAAQPALQVQLSRCLAIPGVLQRLACYDGVAHGAGISAAAPPRIASTAPALPAPAPPAYVPQLATVPASSFGSERLAQSEASRRPVQDRVVSEVVRFDTNARGKFILTLANGQVWKQVDGDDSIARPRKSARSVAIEHALFGSYALTFNDSSQRYKVARVQ